MNKKVIPIILCSFLIIQIVYGQSSAANITANTNTFPQEKIFLHYNSSFLLSGESLYYKVYCLNAQNNSMSDLSKMVYVELVDQNRNIIFKHKIKLESGQGQGDYFIPTNLRSGNYKLIAYSQWMINYGVEHFFQSDLAIINPFTRDQKEVLSSTDSITLSGTNPIMKTKDVRIDNSKHLLSLNLDKVEYQSRQKVMMKVEPSISSNFFGNYSLSVRKTEEMSIPERITALEFSKKEPNEFKTNSFMMDDSIQLPEVRGEILSGKVVSKSSNLPASNIKVGLSVPGRNFLFKVSNTNQAGVFYFNLDKNIENSSAIFQVIDKDKENFKIEIFKNKNNNYDDLIFNKFTITNEWQDALISHSVFNQIENTYSSIKLDSMIEVQLPMPFYESKADEYLLDDYNRFPSIRETMIEIIPNVYTKKSNGLFSLHVRIYIEGEGTSSELPLVIVDGILIQDHNELVLYNPKNVKKISVIGEQYVYGGKIFKGVISIQTFEGNYQQNISGDFIRNVTLVKPFPVKKYFNQVYDESPKYDLIPDYRSQLLWEPILNLGNHKSINFYTSDNIGTYEICLEGFTEKGTPVSIKKFFDVVKSAKQ